MIALASATGHARTWPASRTGAGEMMPSSILMLPVLRGFAVRLRPRHAATSPGWEDCPEQADARVVALMAKTALSSAYSAIRRRAAIAARLRTVVNADRQYTINNRRSERFRRGALSLCLPLITGSSEAD